MDSPFLDYCNPQYIWRVVQSPNSSSTNQKGCRSHCSTEAGPLRRPVPRCHPGCTTRSRSSSSGTCCYHGRIQGWLPAQGVNDASFQPDEKNVSDCSVKPGFFKENNGDLCPPNAVVAGLTMGWWTSTRRRFIYSWTVTATACGQQYPPESCCYFSRTSFVSSTNPCVG